MTTATPARPRALSPTTRPAVPYRRTAPAGQAKTDPSRRDNAGRADYVTRSEFDSLSKQLARLTELLSAVTAAPPAMAPDFEPPAPLPAEDDFGAAADFGTPEDEDRPAPELPRGRRRAAAGGPLAAPGDSLVAEPICGKEGTVKIGSTELPEITKWTFKPNVSLQSYASNKTNGFKRKVCGSKDATGTLEGKWDRKDPITDHFQEGDSVILSLHVDDTRTVTVQAFIKSLDLEVDMDENTITAWSAEFEADGEWVYDIDAAS